CRSCQSAASVRSRSAGPAALASMSILPCSRASVAQSARPGGARAGGEMHRKLERIAEGIVFGEGPRWHEGKLFFSDIRDHAVKAVAPGGEVEIVVRLAGDPSGLGWLPDGRMLVVSMDDHRLLRLEARGLVEVADLTPHCGGKANDMVVDAHGRAYIGNIG